MNARIEAQGSRWIFQTEESDWMSFQNGSEMFIPAETLISIAREGGIDFQVRPSRSGTEVNFLPSFVPDIQIGEGVEIIRTPKSVIYRLNGPDSVITIQQGSDPDVMQLKIGNLRLSGINQTLTVFKN